MWHPGDAAFPLRPHVQLAPGAAEIVQADDLAGRNVIEQPMREPAGGETADVREQKFDLNAVRRAPLSGGDLVARAIHHAVCSLVPSYCSGLDRGNLC